MLIVLQEVFSSGLLLHEVLHGLVALPFAYLLWKKTGSKKLVVLLFVVTYLVDLDHLVDYFSFYGFSFNLSDFLASKHFEITQRAYVPFHAWEWIVLLGIMAKSRGWKSYLTALVLGLLAHFIYDAITQRSFLFYSIAYRALVSGFGFLW